MQSNRIEFLGAQGDLLAARLDLPREQPRAFAIFAHCFTCSKDILAASRIARGLAARDMGVLRFDFTGIGHSEGEFANTNFSSNIEDLILAADWLRTEYQAPAILVGHSLGGAAVLAAAESIPESVAVATIGAPADPTHLEKILHSSRETIAQSGETTVNLGGQTFTIRQQFLDDLQRQNQSQRIGALRKALLVLHSPIDNLVGIDHAAKIFQAAKHPKSFISLDNADHLLTRRDDAAYVAEVLAAWVGRYLPASVEPVSGETAADSVMVQESGAGQYAQQIQAGRHLLSAGEPLSVGGDDSGPSPYELLLASLGACTSMTLRMYADRKKLALDRVSVRLRHEKIHAKDCQECESKDGWVDHIEREIKITGDLDAAQRRRMLEIAERCPIHRTLQSEVRIATREADDA